MGHLPDEQGDKADKAINIMLSKGYGDSCQVGHLSDEQGDKADKVINIMLSKGLVTAVRWVINLMNREIKLIK